MSDTNWVPSNPEDRKKIRDAIYEMAGCLQFIADKREYMKDVADMLKEKYEMPAKVANAMARTAFKHNFSEVSGEADMFITGYETIMLGDTEAPSSEDSDDGDGEQA